MIRHGTDPYQTGRHEAPAAKHQPHTQPCPCGCAPCDELGCDLECVERPRFYCGQLLGEDDLTALVDWTQARLRLARFRHGWGVVCGLNVRCDHDNPTGVVVSAGYAVDCCGNDIVVCNDYKVDLADACADATCRDPWKDYTTGQVEGREDEMVYPCADIAGMLNDGEILDLYLAYDETDTHPETSSNDCGCGQGRRCEFSRTQEGFRVRWQTSSGRESDPRQLAYDEWEAATKRHMQKLAEFLQRIEDILLRLPEGYDDKGDAPGAEDRNKTEKVLATLRRTLEGWLRQHPLHHFCFVESCLMAEFPPSASRKVIARLVARMLFWLALDYRLSWLHCDCPTCRSSSDIPLARVWLTTGNRANRTPCRVALIADWAPYRRDLQKDDCLPAPLGCINLGRFLGKTKELVATHVVASYSDVKMPDDLMSLRRWIASEQDVNHCYERGSDEGLRMVTAAYPGETEQRVIGYTMREDNA